MDAQDVIEYGPMVLVLVIIVINIIGCAIGKRYFLKWMAKACLVEIFGCVTAVIRDYEDEVHDATSPQIDGTTTNAQVEADGEDCEITPLVNESSNSKKPFKKTFVNTNCSNIQIDIGKNVTLRNVYAIHFNYTVLVSTYLFLQTLFLQEEISGVCLDGYTCKNRNKSINCNTTGHETGAVKFLCQKYDVESLGQMLLDIGVFTGFWKFFSEINIYIFKMSYKLFNKLNKKHKNVNSIQQQKLLKNLYVLYALTLTLIAFWIVIPFVTWAFDNRAFKQTDIIKAISLLIQIISTLATSYYTSNANYTTTNRHYEINYQFHSKKIIEK